MKDKKSKEALFNEIKGSLFEYLFARELSRQSKVESEFLKSLDPKYQTVLSQQDRMVREFYPDLTPFLAKMGQQSAKYFIDNFNENVTGVNLLGKFVNTDLSEDIKEADLVIRTDSNSIPLSLKLTKESAYVNTKSGGIKSFIKTYFPFGDSEAVQASFNQFVDQIFLEMSYAIHQEAGLEFDGSYKEWVRAGNSELPGELPDSYRKHIHEFYAKVKSRIYDELVKLYKSHPEEFLDSLPALCGFSDKNLAQLTCYHDFSDRGFTSGKIHLEFFNEDSFSRIESFNLHPELSYFDIVLPDRTLQIRVKSMNKFTSTAMKINCSIKFKQLV